MEKVKGEKCNKRERKERKKKREKNVFDFNQQKKLNVFFCTHIAHISFYI